MKSTAIPYQAVALILFMGQLVRLPARENKSFDGRWWGRVSKAQKSAWVDGYGDCHIYDKGQRNDFAGTRMPMLVDKISDYYRKQHEHGERDLSLVVLEQARSMHVPETPGGEVYSNPHGFYLGDYFRGLLEPGAREAFVQGYLACYATVEHPKARFSNPARWYTDQISQWFGLNEQDESKIDDKRANIPIADALFEFRDGAGKK